MKGFKVSFELATYNWGKPWARMYIDSTQSDLFLRSLRMFWGRLVLEISWYIKPSEEMLRQSQDHDNYDKWYERYHKVWGR